MTCQPNVASHDGCALAPQDNQRIGRKKCQVGDGSAFRPRSPDVPLSRAKAGPSLKAQGSLNARAMLSLSGCIRYSKNVLSDVWI
jgi:hypothetical protein